MINMDNGTTLGVRRNDVVKYAGGTSASEGMETMVHISRGVCSYFKTPFMIFQNNDRNYPIRSIKDNIPGVCYRTVSKGWIDRRVITLWVQERSALSPLANKRKRVIFLDNYACNFVTPKLKLNLDEINKELSFFPPNSMDLIQLANCFIIQKIEAA